MTSDAKNILIFNVASVTECIIHAVLSRTYYCSNLMN